MFKERSGLIVWLNDLKHTSHFERFGTVHYISKKMQYLVLYVNAEQVEEIIKTLSKLPYVKNIEMSHRNDIKTEYSGDKTDKTQFYSL